MNYDMFVEEVWRAQNALRSKLQVLYNMEDKKEEDLNEIINLEQTLLKLILITNLINEIDK